MSRSRVFGVCLGLAAAVGWSGSAGALPAPRPVTAPHHHGHHLHQALKDLQAAHHAAKANNAAAAHKDLTAAVHQLEQAIHRHQQYQATLVRTGLTGFTVTAFHQNHHTHMHKAVHDARAANKQISAGHAKKALADIAAAEHQTRIAIGNHPNW